MRQGAKPAKSKVEAKSPIVRKSRKGEGSRVQDLEKRLAEALDQQTATSEILRVISSSPTDVQPVFDAIVLNASRLCGGEYAIVIRYDGEMMHRAAQHNPRPGAAEPVARLFPRAPARGSSPGRAILNRRLVHIPDVLEDPEYDPDVVRAAGLRGVLSMPMFRDGKVIGAISVSRDTPGPFAQTQIDLLQTFADQAVIAIENVRLFTELQARNHDLTTALDQQMATADVLRIIAQSPTELQPVLDAIATSAVRLCAASDAVIERLDGDRFYNAAHAGAQMKGLVGLPLPLSRRFPGGRAVLDQKRVILDDIHLVAETEYPETLELLKLNTIHSVAEIPLLSEGKPFGSLAVLRAEVRPFRDGEIALLETFASQAVIAIDSARLFDELQARNRDLTTAHARVTEALERQTATSEILRVISSAHTDAQLVFDTIVQRAVRLCNAANAAVFRTDGRTLYEPSNYGGSPEALAATRSRYPRPLDMDTARGIAILTRSVVHTPDIEDPSAIEFTRQGGRLLGFRSMVTVPMLREGEAVGPIIVARRAPGRFTDAELELLKTFADQAVIAIENVRLFTELQARNRDLTEALEQQTATAEVLRIISTSPTELQPVLEVVVKSAVRFCGADDAIILRLDGEHLRAAAHHGPIPVDFALPVPCVDTVGGPDDPGRSAAARGGLLAAPLNADVKLSVSGLEGGDALWPDGMIQACPTCSSTRGVTCRPLRHLCLGRSPHDETVRPRSEEGGHHEHTERCSRHGLAVGNGACGLGAG